MLGSYSEHNVLAEFLVQWGTYVFLVAIVIAPLVWIFFDKKRLHQWNLLISAYIFSFLIYVFTEYLYFYSLGDWLEDKILNNIWLNSSLLDGFMLAMAITVPLLWVVSVFFIGFRRFGFSLKKFFFITVVAVLLSCVLVWAWISFIAYGLGQLSNYL